MPNIDDILRDMAKNPNGVNFVDLRRVCEHFFGPGRQSSGSHCVYKTPWQGDPRVNIQNDHGKAKTYQVRQVLSAVKKLKGENDEHR